VRLTSRELPSHEWDRLAGTALAETWPQLSPDHTRVVVVEDEAGAIVGTCAVMTWVHAEGFSVAPAYRRKGMVWRMLLHALGDVSRDVGVDAMVAGSDSPEMTDYLTRLGASALPASFFVVPMNGFFSQKES